MACCVCGGGTKVEEDDNATYVPIVVSEHATVPWYELETRRCIAGSVTLSRWTTYASTSYQIC
jgi:hypothetical protein